MLKTNDEISDGYYRAVEIVLNTIAKTISAREKITKKFVYSGRNGSSSFEDHFLKPLIRKHIDTLYEPINEALSDADLTGWSLYEISAEENLNDANARTMEDIAIVLRRPNGFLVEEAVNIKATLGNTADNVGGWISMDRALFGNSSDGKYAKQRSEFLDKIAVTPITDSLSDYFLWVFPKLDNGNDVLNSSHVSSYFGTTPDAFYVNKNQSFPLQFNNKNAYSLIGSGIPIIDRKVTLLAKLHSEMSKKLSKELSMHEKALEKVLEQVPDIANVDKPKKRTKK